MKLSGYFFTRPLLKNVNLVFCRPVLPLVFISLLLLIPWASVAQGISTPQGTLLEIEGTWYVQTPNGSDRVDVTTITLRKKPGVPEHQVLDFTDSLGLTRIREAMTGFDDYSLPPEANFIDIYNALREKEEWLEISINCYREFLFTPNDAQYGTQQWYLDKMDMPNAWNSTTGSSNVVIAIIDNGTDWTHPDLGMGSDNHQNIFLNSGEDPWTDPNDPTTGDGIDNDGNGYVDDWKGWDVLDDDNDARGDVHGTHMAGIVGAKTNNVTGIAGVAGGNNSQGSRLLVIKAGDASGLRDQEIVAAIEYAILMEADIINMSFGSSVVSLFVSEELLLAYDAGIFLVAASGKTGQNIPEYPARDWKVFSVGGTVQNDTRLPSSNYGKYLDAAAPASGILSTTPNSSYTTTDGTSAATAIVSGIAALMKSVNPCLSSYQIGDILRESADKVGGYNYGQVKPNALDFFPPYNDVSEELGHGRINAYKAVVAAIASQSANLDLHIKDLNEDLGYSGSYPFTWHFDNSPDIWFNHLKQSNWYLHENPNVGATEGWVSVIVRNKSCVPSTGNELLNVYWSRASSVSSWPANWDGSSPQTGNLIGTVNIPQLDPGEFVRMDVQWDMTSVNLVEGEGICLLARIESIDDPITVYPNELHNDIYHNNNIAIKNLIVEDSDGEGFMAFDGRQVPSGGSLLIGAGEATEGTYDIHFNPTQWLGVEDQLLNVAEVTVHVTQSFWDIANASPELAFEGVEVLNDHTLRINQEDAFIRGLYFPAGQRIPIHLGFSFLAEHAEEEDTTYFSYHISQYDANALEDALRGAVHFNALRPPRESFEAYAGGNQEIYTDESATLQATSINEPATYNWYHEDSLVYSGTSLNVLPDSAEELAYKLEVIASADGFKAYDSAKVVVKHRWITGLTPNPTSGLVTVDYDLLPEVQAANLSISNTSGLPPVNYTLDVNQGSKQIDLSTFTSGIYTVSLTADGTMRESRIIVVQ